MDDLPSVEGPASTLILIMMPCIWYMESFVGLCGSNELICINDTFEIKSLADLNPLPYVPVPIQFMIDICVSLIDLYDPLEYFYKDNENLLFRFTSVTEYQRGVRVQFSDQDTEKCSFEKVFAIIDVHFKCERVLI
ncbi:hypothetical protein VNO77_04724 [Canavalia gladiata]|uniref:Uncharacterized protein n=1 Tax=Canavalia gladiata TaxID=3824 RepID=A0AAN9MZ13_CANGL